MSLVLKTVLGTYVCDVCQLEQDIPDSGKDIVKRGDAPKSITLHLYDFVLPKREMLYRNFYIDFSPKTVIEFAHV